MGLCSRLIVCHRGCSPRKSLPQMGINVDKAFLDVATDVKRTLPGGSIPDPVGGRIPPCLTPPPGVRTIASLQASRACASVLCLCCHGSS